MALIAPGAFLWMTYQLQAANTDVSGKSTALDMWTGIVIALIIAFLTAFAFAELARRYPKCWQRKCLLFRRESLPRPGKNPNTGVLPGSPSSLLVGQRIYLLGLSGVMVAFFAVLATYIAGQFGLVIPIWGQIVIACAFSALVGYIAMRGITGSTTASIAINIIQLSALVCSRFWRSCSGSRILWGFTSGWYQPAATSIVLPHNLAGMLFQSTIAMLILGWL